MESGEYTDSTQIIKKREARDSKKRAIHAARRTGREFKEKMQSITSSPNTDGTTERIEEILEVFNAHQAALLTNAMENQK